MRAIFVAALLGSLAVTAPASAAIKLKPTPRFSVDPSGACAPSNGIMVYVSADLPEGTTKAKARALKKKYAPKGAAQLRVNGAVLLVKRDSQGDFVSNVQVSWGFRTVEVPASTAKAALGKRAKLSYTTKAGPIVLRKKVSRAGCG